MPAVKPVEDPHDDKERPMVRAQRGDAVQDLRRPARAP